MTYIVFFLLSLLGSAEAQPSAIAGTTHVPSFIGDKNACSPATIPMSIVSPDGKLEVVFEVEDAGVRRLSLHDRRSGRVLFNGKYDLTSVLWTKKNQLILGVSPIYDRPRIVLLEGSPIKVHVLLVGTHRDKYYPDGTDYFLLCSTRVYGGKTFLQFLRFPDVDKIDFSRFPNHVIQSSIQISR